MTGLEPFGDATRAWFAATFAAPTRVQAEGWARIAAGEHALLTAPTGSGKTLAAFLYALDRLARRPEAAEPGVRVLYVSPLKALAHDVERNLRAPLIGIERAAEGHALPFRRISVALRTGDTPPRERRLLTRQPAELLITTPESLYLLLTTRAREALRTVETVIVDEIHALAPTKRGAHLALSLERLAALTGRDPQRIGLSATMRPLDEIARFLGGDRAVAIVDAGERPGLDLVIEVPADQAPEAEAEREAADEAALRGVVFDDQPRGRPQSLEAALDRRLVDLLAAHRSTIIFTNSRRLCERLAGRINELAGRPLVRAHHGSLARPLRIEIEELLKAGQLKGLVATSSLELGIDMGAVDLVVQVESPGSVSRGLQRVGRAGHQVGARSLGHVMPRHRMDLLECAVVGRGMRQGDVEPIRVPRQALDVLAQQIVAMATVDEWAVDDLYKVIARAHGYRGLSRAQLVNLLDMLAGRLPADDFPELRPRLIWDRARDVVAARKDARLVAIVNGGTIPDRGLYAVHLGEDGPRVGELDEEMVHESRPGHVFLLGASSWRIDRITRDKVVVLPAPGEPGKMPFWRGEGPGRPVPLGRALGGFVRELGERNAGKARRWLEESYDLEPAAAARLVDYVHEQRAATGMLPSDRTIVIERFRDELGDHRICILTPFGRRLHAPWALALEKRLRDRLGLAVQCVSNDDGIVLRVPDGDELPDAALLVPGADELEGLLVEELGRSAIFATHFRENAARALLLPRRRPGQRTPLWMQRMRAQNLLDAARAHASFPIVLETMRECLDDVFDVPALTELFRQVARGEVAVHEVETRAPSPFARDLAYAFVAAYLYDGDAPLAERKAQALALDRHLLAELLGQEDLRELLDPAAIDEVEAELQSRAEDYRVRSADGAHDLLRRIGDLTPDELAERADGDAAAFAAALEQGQRAARVRIAGQARLVAVEDLARYRDALGVPPPPGVPAVYLATPHGPAAALLEGLLARYARTRGPFTLVDAAARFGIAAAALAAPARALVAGGKLVEGAFRPGGRDAELCDAEVLRSIRRRSLARLRREVAPVDAPALARFLVRWHGIGEPRGGPARLREVIDTLEGLPLPFSELEREILRARMAGYEPRLLDELGAIGEVVWIADGAAGGSTDVRVALYRRDRVALLHQPPAEGEVELSPLAALLRAHLEGRGASFFAELSQLASPATTDDVLAALWELALRGLVANDTFAPLRARALGGPAGKRRPRSLAIRAGGRWFATASLTAGRGAAPTERAHARALALLERHGVVSREVVAAEELPGGFAGVLPVLRALEEAGKARRGHFVDGFAGAQFARPDAVDRLRAARAELATAAVAHVMSAVDPACPWGAALPWPGGADDGPAARPRRVAGAKVVLVHGRPVLYVEKGGKSLRILDRDGDPADLEAAAAALAHIAARRRSRELVIERVDGDKVLGSSHTDLLARAGFRVEPGGMVFRAE